VRISAFESLHEIEAAFLRRWRALPENLRGAVWTTLAALAFTLMAAVIKTLGSRLDSFEIVFFRCVFALGVTFPFLLREGEAAFRTRRPGLHLSRAATGMLAMFFGYYGITKLPLADATVIGFTRALFMIPLAVLFLGERVQIARWAAAAAGFLGVVVMLRPGAEGPVFAVLVAFLGAGFTALGIVQVKKLAATEHPATILVFYNFATTLMSLPAVFAVWITPTFSELALLGLVAGLAGAGQFFTIRGYGIAEASAVVPFGYSRMIFAPLLGLAFWGEIPDGWSLAGGGVIVASTLFIALREARRKRGGKNQTPRNSP
jgi:drug/metabolite transporter (DMT)-like permease